MAITQPSPSSPLLLGVGGSMPSLNAGATGGQALGAPLQGGGFHFHFTGSLQAYQEARAGADAGRVLPPNGESLPGHSAVKPDSEANAAAVESSLLPVSGDGVDADASLLQGESGSSPVVVPSAEAIGDDRSQGADAAVTRVSQQTGTLESTESDVDKNNDLQRDRPEHVEGERGNPSLRPSDSAQQAAAQASRERGAEEHSAVQPAQQQSPLNQQTAQSPEQVTQVQAQQPGQAPQTQQEQKEQQAQQAQQAGAGQADEAESGYRADGRAEAVRQGAAARSDETSDRVRATPAQPFPGEGKPAEPAVSAADIRRQAPIDTARDVAKGVAVAGAAFTGVDDTDAVAEPVQSLQGSNATAPSGVSGGAAEPLPVQSQGDHESAAHEMNQAVNLQSANVSSVSSTSPSTSSSDGAQDAPVVAANVLRTGGDVGAARAQPDIVAGRADQAIQFSNNGGMGDESGEQPSQRQESAQSQAQATTTSRAQAAPSGVSLPQQPFSLAQQQLLSPKWGRAMGERAIMMAQHGPRVAQIQLDPPELGAMQIRIHMQGGDQVSVSFTSPNPMVREALEQQMPRLREMFADQGLNLQDSSVADQSSQQRSGQHDQAPQGHAGSGRYGGGDAGAGEGMTMQAVKVGLVDYYA